MRTDKERHETCRRLDTQLETDSLIYNLLHSSNLPEKSKRKFNFIFYWNWLESFFNLIKYCLQLCNKYDSLYNSSRTTSSTDWHVTTVQKVSGWGSTSTNIKKLLGNSKDLFHRSRDIDVFWRMEYSFFYFEGSPILNDKNCLFELPP